MPSPSAAWPCVPWTRPCVFWRTRRPRSCPKGYVLDYTGESRQLRTEGNTFIQAFGLAVVLIFLVLAAQFNSFRDPFVILAGSVPLAMFGALVFTFLKMPDPNVPFWTKGMDHHDEYLQPGGPGDPGGPGVQKRHSHRGVRQQPAAAGAQPNARPSHRRHDPPATDPDDHRRHHRRPFPPDLVTGAGAQARNSIGLVLVGGMAIGTLFTLFVVPSIYMLVARDHTRDAEALTRLTDNHPMIGILNGSCIPEFSGELKK
jgi:multidrug efflux pump